LIEVGVFGWRVWVATTAVLRLAVPAAIVAFAGWLVFDRWAAHERLSEQRVLDSRVFELMTRASAPGSALACLDALAGEAIETACEKALFASPEAVAAAVSYVAAQLTLLTAGHEHARRMDRNYGAALAQVRRAAGSDRFGIVAHILATRDGCSSQQCGAFVLFDDPSRVSANITEQTFDAHVKRHAAAWSGEVTHPVATEPTPSVSPPAPAPVAGARNPNNLFFPSASSIPPVSIMNEEPGPAQDATGSAEAKPARKSSQPLPQARPPANASAAPPAPLPLGPSPQ
jgi:hypothetical protein